MKLETKPRFKIPSTAPRISRETTGFLKRANKLLIGGKWVSAASGSTFTSYNPATGELLTHCAEGDARDIERAVNAARQAFESGPWRRLTPSERGHILWKIGDLILENADELAE